MNKQDQNKELPQEILKENLKKVSLANECSVLMTLLCEKMGLNPQETTHQEFIQKFAGIQTDSLEAEKQLNELYLLGREVMKPKKKRTKKVVLSSEPTELPNRSVFDDEEEAGL